MNTTTRAPDGGDYEFLPTERPSFPGGPYTPPHPPLRRLAYAAVGIWIGAAGSFANATISVNVANLSGEQGAYVAELSWLPAIYVAANACANLMLVKARAQFSMSVVMQFLLSIYVAVAAMQFVFAGFVPEAAVRFASGVVAAGMTTTGIFYLLQAATPKLRPAALVGGLGMTQLGTPLARLLPVDLLAAHGWFGQHCIELASGLAALMLITWLPLPPTPRLRAFQPLDFVSFALLLPAALLLCGVINRGRLAWWTDTPWLGVALAAAIPLLTTAIAIEAVREKPLLRLDWIGTREFFNFAVIALLMRLALAEQTYGAVGLLTAGNLDDDQLRTLFGWVVVSMLAGVATSVLTLSPKALPWQVVAASLAIAAGAWLDSHASNLTRPEQLYLSQSLIGFGTTLFIGPTLAYGMSKVVRLGPSYLITLVVVFSMTQNIGGLIGSAVLGSYQTVATRAHFLELSERMPEGDPQIANRIAGSTRSLAPTVGDPAVRARQGGASLVASLAREASVLAFNDVFRLIWVFSLATGALVVFLKLLSVVWPALPIESA